MTEEGKDLVAEIDVALEELKDLRLHTISAAVNLFNKLESLESLEKHPRTVKTRIIQRNIRSKQRSMRNSTRHADECGLLDQELAPILDRLDLEMGDLFSVAGKQEKAGNKEPALMADI